jgi:mono/diheme cytochrome c family protein
VNYPVWQIPVGVALLVLGSVALLVLGSASIAGRAAPSDSAALGEKVMTDFCLSCHTLDGPGNPLRPKLDRARFGTEADAYRSIGRLEEMNSNMILQFGGTEEERRALARQLAKLANGRR